MTTFTKNTTDFISTITYPIMGSLADEKAKATRYAQALQMAGDAYGLQFDIEVKIKLPEDTVLEIKYDDLATQEKHEKAIKLMTSKNRKERRAKASIRKKTATAAK